MSLDPKKRNFLRLLLELFAVAAAVVALMPTVPPLALLGLLVSCVVLGMAIESK